MPSVYLGLGASIGTIAKKTRILDSAFVDIARLGTDAKCSSYHQTEPWGGVTHNMFLNAACTIKTDLSPLDLLDALQRIETLHGRTRETKWDDRTLDIDILVYGNLFLDDPRLILPHPYMHERDFVLAPLREIMPEEVLEEILKEIKARSA